MNDKTTVQIATDLSERIAVLAQKRARAMKLSKLSKADFLEFLVAEEEKRVALKEEKQNRG